MTEIKTLEQAISESMPSGACQGELENALFKYARAIKAYAYTSSDYEGAVGEKGHLKVDFLLQSDAMEKWKTAAEKHLGTVLDEHTIWVLFYNKLEKARNPSGEGQFEKAVVLANRLPTSTDLKRKRIPQKLEYLVKFCRALQIISPIKDSFYLSCRWAGKLLKVDHSVAARYLNALVSAGILKVLKAGRTGGRKNTATVYQYISEETEHGK